MSTVQPPPNFAAGRLPGRFARLGPVGRLLRCAPLVGLAACVTGIDGHGALTLRSSSPVDGATWPANAPLVLRFDRYLGTVPSVSPSVSLVSGDVPVPVGLLYDPVERAVVVLPAEELTPGVGYLLTISEESLRGLDGSTLSEPLEIGFSATAGGVRPADPLVDFEADVRPVFERRCGCHGPPPLAFPALEPASLIDRPGRRSGALPLVAPGAPLRSGLVRKILPGYPGVTGDSMPPEGTLPTNELRVIVDWIRDL